MPKRNFILLIIILGLVIIAVFGFLYFQKEPSVPEDSSVGTNFISQFNPFATKPKLPAVTPPADISNQPPSETTETKLIKVSNMPVAGFTVFTKERLKDKGTEFAPALRYVEKASGNIYQTFVDKIEERKFSKTIILKIYDAYFGNRGESVVMRYLKENGKTIETFAGTLPKELLGGEIIGNNEIKGSFLPNNVKDISVSPDGSKIFYLFVSGNNIVGTILNLSNNKKVQVFDSPFTEWLSLWPVKNIITFTTKPSANIPGHMYSADTSGKNLTKVLGNINGLTTLESPNGKLVLYGDNTLSLYIYHIDSRNSDPLGVKTLPEKCIWGKMSDVAYCAVPKSINPGEYPDVWYQGEVSFGDQFWKIDIKTGNATLLLDPVAITGGEKIDGVKLALDENENYLFFVNKKDNFLWKLDLK